MSKRKSSMTATAASRIQSSTAKSNNGVTPKGSFAARAQSAVKNSGGAPPNGPSTTGKPSGGGRSNNAPKGK